MELLSLIMLLLLCGYSVLTIIYLVRHSLAYHKYKPIYDTAFRATWDSWKTEIRESHGDLQKMQQVTEEWAACDVAVCGWCDKAREAFFCFPSNPLLCAWYAFKPIYTQEQIAAFSQPYLGEEDWAEIITETK